MNHTRQRLEPANVTGWPEDLVDQWLRDNLQPVGASDGDEEER